MLSLKRRTELEAGWKIRRNIHYFLFEGMRTIIQTSVYVYRAARGLLFE